MKHSYLRICLLTLFALISCIPSISAKVKIGDLYYNLDTSAKTAEVTYYYKSSNSNCNYVSGDLAIPENIVYESETYTVTSISEYAFYWCARLTSVTIPNSVTSIGTNAFYNCNGLTSVIIPNSVTKIGLSAFYWCSGLTSVTIGNSVTSIGHDAFYDCSGLTSVHINDLAAWCNISFDGSSSNPLYYAGSLYLNGNEVKELTIPNSVTTIGSYAFSGCTGLTSATIPNSVTTIGDYAFSGCTGLKKLTIVDGENVLSIGDVFSFCPLSEIYIGRYLSNSNKSPFENKKTIKLVTIGNSVTSIGSSIFSGCTGLTSVTIGNSVTSIGSNAFSNSGLKKAIWLTNTPPKGASNVKAAIHYVSNDQYNFSNQKIYPFLSSKFEVDNIMYVPVSPSDRTCDVIDCCYNPTSKSIKIDSVVTNRNVELKVLNVNPYAFYDNDFVSELSISNQGYIGEYAFYGCNSLTNATINNQGYIGDYAFADCRKNKTLTIGQNVTTIGNYAFNNNKELKEVVIPNNISSAGKAAFSGCSSLESVKLGKGLKSLSESLFNGCSSLGSITIPNNIESIGDNVFKGCTSLQNVTFEDAIGSQKSGLTLGYNGYSSYNGSSSMFADCPLDEVYIGRKLSYKTSSNYGYSPFYRNTSLRTVTITDDETEIYDNEFYGCSNLQEFSCGDGVTKIGKWAFSGCSALQSYASGTSVQTIGEEAFSDCFGLTSFVSHASVPPICGAQALDDINKWECTLYVPSESIDDYQQAEQWKEFFFINDVSGVDNVAIDGDESVSIETTADGIRIENADQMPVEIYTLDGRLWKRYPSYQGEDIDLAQEFYIVRVGNISKKIKF